MNNLLTEQEATRIALDALQKRAIPFREQSIVGKLLAHQDAVSYPVWRISLDIPMPLGMQDEYFTVEINAQSGAFIGIITPTGSIV